MSNNFTGTMNPAQFNPALLEAMNLAQAQGGIGANGSVNKAAFATFHQAFQRLQSQESQKQDQQRLGIPPSGGQQGGQSQQQQQQQFLQIMQQAGMLPNNQSNENINFNMAMLQQQAGNQGGMQGMDMASLANMAQNGLNVHSQQQGLNLPGMLDEQGRRQMLQNMLSQQVQNQPQQQHNLQQQYQPQQQQPQHQSQQQQPMMQQTPQMQSMQLNFANAPVANSAQIRDFIQKNPEVIAQINRRHPDNQQAIRNELSHIINATQNMGMPTPQTQHNLQQLPPQQPVPQSQQQQPQPLPDQQQLRQPPFNYDTSQIPQNYLLANQSMAQMQRPSPQIQHQRLPSNDQFQLQAMQNQMNSIPVIDPKQMEAAMKAAQSRGGLVTPQMSANNLPIVSPQATLLSSGPQQLSLGGMTPQMQNQQLQMMPQPPSMQQNGQMQPPPPVRTASQSQMSQMQGGPPGPSKATAATDVQGMMQAWGDSQLSKSTNALVAKIQNYVLQNPASSSAAHDDSKFHLLLIIAEWKRRNKDPPANALQCAGQALGNPQLVGQLVGADWSTLANFAKQRMDAAVVQAKAENGQAGPSSAVYNTGSQTNPIEIITPTMNGSNQLPTPLGLADPAFQTPQNQISVPTSAPGNDRQGNQQMPQRPPQQQMQPQQPVGQQQRQPSGQLSRMQLPQVTPQQQQQAQEWLQQQQQQQQQQQSSSSQTPSAQQQQLFQPNASGSTPSTAQKTKPWTSMDFKSEPIPLKEEPFWAYLGQMHLKRTEPLAPPMIDGRPVNLYFLFSLVHRNGGSAKVANNLQMWTYMGGYLGFGTEQAEPGQPSRSSPQVAHQLQQLYQQYLQGLEDMFYGKLYKDRLKAAATQVSTPTAQIAQLPIQNTSSRPILPPGAQGMSAQFLDAVSKIPTANLTESQKRTLEEARRQSFSSQNGGPTPQQPTPGSAGVVPMALQPSNVPIPPGMPNTPRSMQAAQMANNPQMVYSWIKLREESMKSKFPKEFRSLSEDEKPRFLSELRAMIPSAREAQEKTPKFLVVALEGSKEDIGTIMNLISMYMFIFIALQHAEAGRFPFSLADLAKLRDPLHKTLFKLNNIFKALASSADGQAHLQKVTTALDSAQPALSSSMPPPTSLPEDIAAKLPKGLRVEDLKPPPAKRQKGTAGRGSPAQSGTAGTPEAKTPVGTADSPAAAPGSSSKKSSAAAGGKRKRQASTSRTPVAQQVAEVKENLAKQEARAVQPAKNNMLGINIDRVEAEVQENAPIFAAYDALRSDSTDATAGSNEIWASLIAAVDQYNADPTNHAVGTHDISAALNQASTSLTSQSGLAGVTSLEGLNALATANSLGNLVNGGKPFGGEDDLFEQFIDVTQVDETPRWALPTPELWRVASREDDSDTSPESIKTVGSTTGLSLKTPLNPAVGINEKDDSSSAVLGGLNSPESSAYNGVIFGGWADDATFDFVTNTTTVQ